MTSGTDGSADVTSLLAPKMIAFKSIEELSAWITASDQYTYNRIGKLGGLSSPANSQENILPDTDELDYDLIIPF